MEVIETQVSTKHGESTVLELLPVLERLDDLLEKAIKTYEITQKNELWNNGFRGLYLNLNDIEELLARKPLSSKLFIDNPIEKNKFPDGTFNNTRFGKLVGMYSLCDFEIDVLLIALAPEIDARYERIYAYLQDDVTCKRPTINMVLDFLCSTPVERIMYRKYFQSGATLIDQGLIYLSPRDNNQHPFFQESNIVLDEQVVKHILGENSLDTRLVSFCNVKTPVNELSTLILSKKVKTILSSHIENLSKSNENIRIYFQGCPDMGQQQAAEAIAKKLGLGLLVMNQSELMSTQEKIIYLIDTLVREAVLKKQLLFIHLVVCNDLTIVNKKILNTIFNSQVNVILSSEKSWAFINHSLLDEPMEVVSVKFTEPNYMERKAIWEYQLNSKNIEVKDIDLCVVAGRFRLTPKQIQSAVLMAAMNTKKQGNIKTYNDSKLKPVSVLSLDELMTAACDQCVHELDTLAKKITPIYEWDDIVVPDETKQQLKEVCQRVAYRHKVLNDWGFNRKLSIGKGTTALFAGPSGTGKTMAAEVIANELNLELYRIDLSGVVSKYIGETEKNLDRIFKLADNANAILFFDEADALFGKRSEVHDSHDRYANIETSYLLQKMEEYDGVVILATNLQQNMDESFLRRLSFTIHFPFPSEESRRHIWESIWPMEISFADDVDIGYLASQFKLSGGNIKNIALAAAYLAAEDGDLVTIDHITHSIQREYQKIGKTLSKTELQGISHNLTGQTECI